MDFSREDADRIIGNIRKEVFDKLSEEEKDKVLQEFIDMMRYLYSDPTKVVAHVLFDGEGEDKIENILSNDIKEAFRNLNDNELKILLREVISAAKFDIQTLSKNEMEDLLQKHKNNELSEEEEKKLKSIVKAISKANEKTEDELQAVSFTSYSMITFITNILKENVSEDLTVKPTSDVEAYLTVSYIMALGAILADNDSVLSKIFSECFKVNSRGKYLKFFGIEFNKVLFI
jgi:vacuolar-type H+-ATPase subunit E/Vma4